MYKQISIMFISFLIISTVILSVYAQVDHASVLLPENNKSDKKMRKKIVPKRIDLPKTEPLDLKPYAFLDAQASIEPSGLVKSRLWENVYWSHNDSGDLPRIFPINRNGDVYESSRYGGFDGCQIQDAVNVDWEDIAIDDEGFIILGDFGHASSYFRRDFCLYYLIEPHFLQGRTSVFKKVFFTYPDYTEIPPHLNNFDSESLFVANGKPYIITKHRSDAFGKLYRLDNTAPGCINILTYLDCFDFYGKTTAADCSPDGTRLAVLTYNAIWLFTVQTGSDAYFDGAIKWAPINIGQCEAICFDGEDRLMISSNEQKGFLY
ncbi:hypothetical protein EH221_05210, partial [bacterium]